MRLTLSYGLLQLRTFELANVPDVAFAHQADDGAYELRHLDLPTRFLLCSSLVGRQRASTLAEPYKAIMATI